MIREYIVAISWRRVSPPTPPRLNTKRYLVIGRCVDDAKQFAVFRFERTHPGHIKIEEVEVEAAA